MTDFGQMIRWNASFVRGLAQSVLERARTIRGSLNVAAPQDQPKVVAKMKHKKTVRRGKSIRRKTNG